MSLSSLERSTKTETPTKKIISHSDTETPLATTSTSADKASSGCSTHQRHSTLAKFFGDPIPIKSIEEPNTHKKPLKLNLDSTPDEINSETKPSLKSLIQVMGFRDKSPEYQACMNFLEAICPKNKGIQTDEVVDLISSDESPNKTVILYIENKISNNEVDNNTNNNAMQEENEKAEDDKNNQEVEETKK